MSEIAALVADNLDLWTSAIERKSSTGRGGGKRFSLYGIERLRALILDLAVSGKLVEGDVPVKLSVLGQAGEWVGGNGFPKQYQGKSDGEFPFLKVSDMNLVGNDRRITTSNNYVSAADLRALRAKTHPAGTIIFPKIGGAIATNKRRILSAPSAIDNNCAGQIPRTGISVDWLYMVLSSIDMAAYQVGTSVPALNMKRLSQHPIAIPTEAEQQRIVAKVDELMALCEALERESADAMAAHQALVEELLATLVNSANAADLAANWPRLETHFDTLFTTDASIEVLKQTILDLAVRGKLVEQDAGDESASELLKQTAKGKAELVRHGLAKRDKALPRVDQSNVPFALPYGWTWARFPELGIFERGKSKHRPRNDPKLFSPGIYPLIQTGEVARATGLITEVHSHYSELGLAQSKLWKKGTLCITIAANIADAAIMGFDACFPDSVVGFVPAKPISNPSYFLYFIRTAKADLLRFAPSTAQKNINLGILETLLIPLPPLAEQRRIVAKVDALMALCDALKARLADAAQTQRHLADAITERAAA